MAMLRGVDLDDDRSGAALPGALALGVGMVPTPSHRQASREASRQEHDRSVAATDP